MNQKAIWQTAALKEKRGRETHGKTFMLCIVRRTPHCWAATLKHAVVLHWGRGFSYVTVSFYIVKKWGLDLAEQQFTHPKPEKYLAPMKEI